MPKFLSFFVLFRPVDFIVLFFSDKTAVRGESSTSTSLTSTHQEPDLSIPIQTGSGDTQSELTGITGLGSSCAATPRTHG